MIYKHQYFTLNDNTREVFDEFERAVQITGNAYLLLLFLCQEKKLATITDLNDFIDRDSDRDEEHFRQYRYKIKLALGHEVVQYKNQRYFIEGEISRTDKADKEEAKEIIKISEKYPKANPVKQKIISKNNLNKKLAVMAISALLIIVAAFWVAAKNKENKNNAAKSQEDMVLIPAGEFIMGSTEEQATDAYKMCEEQNSCVKEDYLAEYPQRKVSLPYFYMDRKEVSNSDYELFVKAANHKAPLFANDSNLNSANQPVVGVSWEDANLYCQWLGKRLPTEPEWEKAARGTDARIWPWGNNWDAAKANHGQGGMPGYDESDGFKYTAPVGTALGVSPYGVLNMAGNASEWVADDFLAYPGNDKFLNSNFGLPYKVIRGGSYLNAKSDIRTAVRWYGAVDYKDDDLGFRCAKDK